MPWELFANPLRCAENACGTTVRQCFTVRNETTEEHKPAILKTCILPREVCLYGIVVMSFDIVESILHRYIVFGMSILRVVSWYPLQSTVAEIITSYV